MQHGRQDQAPGLENRGRGHSGWEKSSVGSRFSADGGDGTLRSAPAIAEGLSRGKAALGRVVTPRHDPTPPQGGRFEAGGKLGRSSQHGRSIKHARGEVKAAVDAIK